MYENIQQYIAQGHLDKVFAILKKSLINKDAQKYSQVIVLQSSYSSANNAYSTNLIDYSEFSRQVARINLGLQDLLAELKENNYPLEMQEEDKKERNSSGTFPKNSSKKWVGVLGIILPIIGIAFYFLLPKDEGLILAGEKFQTGEDTAKVVYSESPSGNGDKKSILPTPPKNEGEKGKEKVEGSSVSTNSINTPTLTSKRDDKVDMLSTPASKPETITEMPKPQKEEVVKKFLTITLVVNSSDKDETVYVDDKEAALISDTYTQKKIRVEAGKAYTLRVGRWKTNYMAEEDKKFYVKQD